MSPHQRWSASGDPRPERDAQAADEVGREAAAEERAPILEPRTGTRLSAPEIHDNIRGAAEEELERPFTSLFFSSLAAGLLIGFSFLAGGFLADLVPDQYAHAASALGYPLGFLFVVLGRNELYTENTLEPVVPLLHERDAETLVKMFRLWGILILGNLVGAAIFAAVLARTEMVDGALHPRLLALASEATTGGFGATLYRAVFGGWLIALMAWLLAATQNTAAQIILIWMTTAPIAAFRFKHSVVGSVEAFYRVAAGSAPLGEMLWHFVLPALIGNAIGGVVLVALLNYAQIKAEHGRRADAEHRG